MDQSKVFWNNWPSLTICSCRHLFTSSDTLTWTVHVFFRSNCAIAWTCVSSSCDSTTVWSCRTLSAAYSWAAAVTYCLLEFSWKWRRHTVSTQLKSWSFPETRKNLECSHSLENEKFSLKCTESVTHNPKPCNKLLMILTFGDCFC